MRRAALLLLCLLPPGASAALTPGVVGPAPCERGQPASDGAAVELDRHRRTDGAAREAAADRRPGPSDRPRPGDADEQGRARDLYGGRADLIDSGGWTPGARPTTGGGSQTDAPPVDPPGHGRVQWGIGVGPVYEVRTPGERDGERGVLVAPSVSVSPTPWLDYVVEGQVAQYFSPDGYVVGVLPVGVRIHPGGRTRPYAAVAAGITATNLTDLTGIDRRINFQSQIGAGVRHVLDNGQAVSFELRYFHLSNLGTAPPNLGVNAFVFLAGWHSR